MERSAVSSSNIAAIGYDEALQTLEVEFKDSAIYQYFNVPLPSYEALMSAPSHGTFLNANIKGQFSYKRL